MYVKDAITDTDGPVVGDIRDRGMEKWIYVSHDAKQVGLLFKEHMPLQVIFADYDYPTVTGQMTYILRLTEISKVSTADIESNNIIQILPETTTFGESVNYDTISDTHYTPIPEIDKNLYDAWRYGYKNEFFNIINSKPDYAGCQYYIGLTYITGKWNNRNDEEALKMFTLAALQGHLQSQEEVGKLYSIYSTLPKEKKNEEKSAYWYLKAANQGSPKAQLQVGEYYIEGWGVPKDYTKAMEWFRKAENQGCVKAAESIGWMYYKGQGVEKSSSKAETWFRKYADLGDVDAMISLGIQLANGYGITKNKKEAKYWFNKAKKLANDLQKSVIMRNMKDL